MKKRIWSVLFSAQQLFLWQEIIYSQFSINSLHSPFSPLSLIISWQACADSCGGFRVMNLYSTTQNNSHKGTSGDVIVFNLIRSNWRRQTKGASAIHRAEVMMCVMVSHVWRVAEEIVRLNNKVQKSCYCPLFCFIVCLWAKRLEDF